MSVVTTTALLAGGFPNTCQYHLLIFGDKENSILTTIKAQGPRRVAVKIVWGYHRKKHMEDLCILD